MDGLNAVAGGDGLKGEAPPLPGPLPIPIGRRRLERLVVRRLMGWRGGEYVTPDGAWNFNAGICYR